MASSRGHNLALFPPLNSMSSSTNEPPSPTSPSSVHPGLSTKPDHFPNAHRSHDSLDSDSHSSSRDSPVSPASNLHLPYSDDSRLNLDTHNEKKNSRRVYFDYGINTPSHQDPSAPLSSKFEDSQDVQTVQHSPFRSYITSYSFPWELPSPTTMSHRAADKDYRTESSSFFHSQPFWLVLYFGFNLGLTLYNKAVLIHFPFAYALTALHALCGSIGGFALLRIGMYVPAKLTDRDNMALLAFSLLYTINIAVSNLSLELVTIPVGPINGLLCVPFSESRPLVPPGRPSGYTNIHRPSFHVPIRYAE